jgi:hypothetical protein
MEFQTAFSAPRGRSSARNFYAFYIFTIKFSKSPTPNFQTFQSGWSSGKRLFDNMDVHNFAVNSFA